MAKKDTVNILMVDDHPSKLMSYEAILAELGENLIQATSGREALEKLLKMNDVAVVLMDVSMPEMDGFETARLIREHPRFQRTAIIFISAIHLTDLDRVKGYQRGAVDYISVPVNPELLRAKVSVFADLHRTTRQLERLNQELSIAQESLRRLSGSLMQSQDEERRRIARELHDGLGQYLVAVKMNLDVLAMKLAPETQMRVGEFLADAIKQIENAISETRTMSHLLHPPLLDEIGLESALVWYAEGFAKRSGIAVNVDIPPSLGRLETEVETALFRVVQECLTNVHRHSGSPTASVRLSRENGELKLEVRDQGRGMPALSSTQDSLQATEKAPGVGLQGIRERILQLRGNVEVISNGEKGTTVIVTLPYTSQSTGAYTSLPRDDRALVSRTPSQ